MSIWMTIRSSLKKTFCKHRNQTGRVNRWGILKICNRCGRAKLRPYVR